ncbi:CRTAC1 family protein [Halorubellus litoreus]|uniref:CRTAC1 family protein n=1 Tax=Halorubellus litoreus TaxID=755308 RepID=A0ABD5VFM5_9EURY
MRPRGFVAGRARMVAVVLVVAAVVGGIVVASGALGFDSEPPSPEIQFRDATEDAGIEYTDEASGIGNGNAGVFAADVNDDGWTDVLALGGERPMLYVNENGSFARSERLPALERPFRSAVFFDYDGDGWTDLLLLAEDAPPVALHNDEGSFERTDLGIGNLTYPQGATVADFDGDGDLDLFVYQSGDWANGKPAGYFDDTGHVADDNGNPNVLFENVAPSESDDDRHRFERVETAGITGDTWSLAASFVDLTGDGRPDIHVANDYNNDTVYVNQGDGTFERRLLGGATARNGMASEVADVNGDGRPDVFVSNIYLPISQENMSAERYERYERLFEFVIHSERTKGNTLLVNQGDGRFGDRADAYGVRRGGWGWAASLTDFDNDGDRDLWQATQHVLRIDPEDPRYTYAMLWEREGSSFRSRDASERGVAERNGRGMVSIDYDNDGDRDVVAATYGGPVTVYENTVAGGNSVAFEVVDDDGATALGAVVTVSANGEETVVHQTANVDYLSQEPRVEHVGLGSATTVTITVEWPDGTTRTFEDVPANARLRVSKDGITVVATYDRGP